jgi:hypothetical protein
VAAEYGDTKPEQTPHTLVYTQPIRHARLENASRRLELWKREPRARLTVRFDRVSSHAPEVLYINFAFPVAGVMPRLSNGGVPFTPYRDQLEGSCRDYFAIDSWAHYATAAGDWLWVTRDAPLVAVGGPHTVERRATPPAEPNRMAAMVFDNCWHTNFVADSHGTMEFQFELAWRDHISDPDALAESLTSQAVLVVNGKNPDSPELLEKIFTP